MLDYIFLGLTPCINAFIDATYLLDPYNAFVTDAMTFVEFSVLALACILGMLWKCMPIICL